MKVGINIFTTEYSIQPAELAIAAEERGIESLLVSEHSHIPVSRESPFPEGVNCLECTMMFLIHL